MQWQQCPFFVRPVSVGFRASGCFAICARSSPISHGFGTVLSFFFFMHSFPFFLSLLEVGLDEKTARLREEQAGRRGGQHGQVSLSFFLLLKVRRDERQRDYGKDRQRGQHGRGHRNSLQALEHWQMGRGTSPLSLTRRNSVDSFFLASFLPYLLSSSSFLVATCFRHPFHPPPPVPPSLPSFPSLLFLLNISIRLTLVHLICQTQLK